MKSFFSLLSVLVFIGVVPAQQPSQRRPTLDQIDLLSVRPTQRAAPADENIIKIDKNDFKTLLEPIIIYSQNTEKSYLNFLDKMRPESDTWGDPDGPRTPVDYGGSYKSLRERTLAINRSITIIKAQLPPSLSAIAVLNANQKTVEDIHETLSHMSGGDHAPYRERLRELAEKYSAPPFEGRHAGELIASKQAIISAMLSAINRNFARFRSDD